MPKPKKAKTEDSTPPVIVCAFAPLVRVAAN